jgi:glycosyltransferase involved in cell wall biosynthesis/peptidoglycan/xylan/chitin deacetylase (PgdA/CDA1 family)
MDPCASTSKSPRKLVHIVLSLETGGLERLVCNLASRPELNGYQTVVCCLDEFGALREQLEESGGRAVLVKRRAGFDLALVWKLARFLRRERATVLHTHSLDPMFYGGLAAWLAGVPLLLHTQHDPLPARYGWKDRVKFHIAAMLFHKVVFVSRQTAEALTCYALPQTQTITVLNGIDSGRFGPSVGRTVRRQGSEWRIGSVARLSPEKGARILLQAFARLHADQPASRLVLAGDGPDRGALESYAGELGIAGAVDFLGARRDVAQLLGTFDLFVLPSLTEGIPLALLEAMAAGLPIVASGVGGVPEVLVDGESGVLVPPGSVNLLHEAMAGLIASDGRRAALAAGAAKRVRERFNERDMANAYRSLYGLSLGGRWREAVKTGMRRFLPAKLMLWSGVRRRPEVAITFDDGPDPLYTPRILDLLKRYDAKATFFLIGEKVGCNGKLVQQIQDEGHEIANHSYSHPHFEQLSWRRAASEIGRAQTILQSHGRRCTLFRPPRGKLCLKSILGAWWKGLTVVMWTVDLKDFSAGNAAEIKSAFDARRLSPGDIILYHGHSSVALEALPHILELTFRNGYRPVVISEMLRA